MSQSGRLLPFLSMMPIFSNPVSLSNLAFTSVLFNTAIASILWTSRRLSMFWARRNSISLQWIKENRHFLLPPVCRPAREQKTVRAMAFFFLAVAFMLEDSHPQGGAFRKRRRKRPQKVNGIVASLSLRYFFHAMAKFCWPSLVQSSVEYFY